MNIKEIESLSENDVQTMEHAKYLIKGYSVYLVDLGEYFGYSALVFYNNHQIKYANDYQLHHPAKSVEELKDFYLKNLESHLFTEDEICEPLKDYNDYRNKRDFLINLYALQTDYISYYAYCKTEEERQSILKQIKNMYRNEVGKCWMSDKDFIDKHHSLWRTLSERNKTAMENYDYCKSAFLYEMFNHEYGINWQADWDVLNCFTRVEYKDSDSTAKYLERTNFSDIQKKAYFDAKIDYFKEASL